MDEYGAMLASPTFDSFVNKKTTAVSCWIHEHGRVSNVERFTLKNDFSSAAHRHGFLRYLIQLLHRDEWEHHDAFWYGLAVEVFPYDALKVMTVDGNSAVDVVCLALLQAIAKKTNMRWHWKYVFAAFVWLIAILQRHQWKHAQLPHLLYDLRERIAKSNAPLTLAPARMEVHRLIKYGPKPIHRWTTPNPAYPERAHVKDVAWVIPDPEYEPVEFTHKAVLDNASDLSTGGGWADPAEWTSDLQEEVWRRTTNALSHDEPVFMVEYVDDDDVKTYRPRNPMGRTGMIGRGLLGKYGANQAADPLITRIVRDADGLARIQMVAIQRSDTKEWAMPGGMVDPEDPNTSATAKREFMEECQNFENPETSAAGKAAIEDLFTRGTQTFEGYVDDPRNTDWAWMETTVWHFHIPEDSVLHGLKLRAGSDAFKSEWKDVDRNLKLYASHRAFVIAALGKTTDKPEITKIFRDAHRFLSA